MNQPDKQSSRYSLAVTAFLQLALLTAFYFITAWQAPDPPLPVYGIELSMTSASDITTTADRPSEVPTQEIISDQTTEPEKPSNETTETLDSNKEQETSDVNNDEALVKGQEENVQELTEVNPENTAAEEPNNENDGEVKSDNEVIVEPNKTPEKEANAQVVPTEIDSSSELTERDSLPSNMLSEHQESDEEVTEAAPIDERALFPASSVIDQSTESNVVLNVSGYQLSEPPKIDDPSNETGSITFKIIVADDGYAIPVQTVQSTLSPSVAALYRDAINQLYFEKTSSQVPPETAGTITFIIKAN